MLENYTELCEVEVDLSQLPASRRNRSSGDGIYYRVDFDIVLLFGLTELEAVVAWWDWENVSLLLVLLHPLHLPCCQSVERRSIAKIIYDPDESDPTDNDSDP